MSADNGVYVLVSRGRRKQHGHKQEYRVVQAQAIENIFTWPPTSDEDCRLDNEQVTRLFGPARVFTDRKIAEGYAQGVFDSFGYIEYGIVWIDEFAGLPFPKSEPTQQPQGLPKRRRQLAAVR